MSRYILTIMSVIAISACSENRPYGTTTHTSGSSAGEQVSDVNSANGNERATSANRDTSRDDQTDVAGVQSAGSEASRSKDRSAASPRANDRRNRNYSTITAGDQSENAADRQITQQIRKAVVADSALSVKAQNCTIVTIDGVVTLRGSVDTASERLAIASKADGVSGVRRVENNLEIIR